LLGSTSNRIYLQSPLYVTISNRCGLREHVDGPVFSRRPQREAAQHADATIVQLWGLMLREVERDIEQLSQLRNGDEEAFVMLVGRYQQPMLRLARSMVSSDAGAE